MAEEINYDAYSGEVLPNGNLRVNTFGRSDAGEIWDGTVEVTPEHPSYTLWLSQIHNKEAHDTALNEERKIARERRRQKHSL